MNMVLAMVIVGVVGFAIGLCLGLLLRRGPSGSDDVKGQLEKLEKNLREEAAQARREQAEAARLGREELQKSVAALGNFLGDKVRDSADLQAKVNQTLGETLNRALEQNARRVDELRTGVSEGLQRIQRDNAEKLEKMRQTVDEKLHDTLEKRLGESFKIVSERLEHVQKGLGEMQNLAVGVGDLKKVLTNVKTRGTWGEVLLGNLLEQLLSPEQYAANVPTKKTLERVEFAIKLPGKSDDNMPVWLPIDSKFPKEDYERLLAAQEAGNAELAHEAGRALEQSVKKFAQDISDKYLMPPQTTDFAIMFLPSEGLYAEVARRGALVEALQRQWRVVVSGPHNLAAFLNSLQMGFRTLAVQKRSSEVWETLGAVKTEFEKYGQLMERVKKKLEEAGRTIDDTQVRSRAIWRQLKNVEKLSDDKAAALLPTDATLDMLPTSSEADR